MKLNNKISSFISALLMAFSIALFVPTAAQATCNNHTTNTLITNNLTTNTSMIHNKAKKHSKCYCKCYNYKYSGENNGK